MNQKNGNSAVVGLVGFGLTTLLLQFHNIGLLGLGPVLAMGIIFGGAAQMIAGFQEQKMGNNFGNPVFNVIAGYELIFCALSAWYMMAGIIINDLAGKTVLPMGKPYFEKK